MAAKRNKHAAAIIMVDMAAVQGVLERSASLLPREDHDLLKAVMNGLINLTRLVQERGTTIARLRALIGSPSSEKTANVLDQKASSDSEPGGAGPSAAPPTSDVNSPPTGDAPAASGEGTGTGAQPKPSSEEEEKKKGHGRVPLSAYTAAEHIHVPHETLREGDRCPGCARGNLSPLKPVSLLRLIGQAPVVARSWDCEHMRCGACGEVYTARAPEEAQGPKCTETAASMIGLLRFGAGVPHYRLEHIQRDLETPLPASTQWDVLDERAALLRPAYDELVRVAAQGEVVHNDDSYARIAEFMGKRRAALLKSGNLPDPERTGLFTTAIVSITAGLAVALFFTGRKHAGENLDDLLDRRAGDLPPAIQMGDGLERNVPKLRISAIVITQIAPS